MTDTCTVCRFVPAEDGSDRCLACAAARTELDGQLSLLEEGES